MYAATRTGPACAAESTWPDGVRDAVDQAYDRLADLTDGERICRGDADPTYRFSWEDEGVDRWVSATVTDDGAGYRIGVQGAWERDDVDHEAERYHKVDIGPFEVPGGRMTEEIATELTGAILTAYDLAVEQAEVDRFRQDAVLEG